MYPREWLAETLAWRGFAMALKLNGIAAVPSAKRALAITSAGLQSTRLLRDFGPLSIDTTGDRAVQRIGH